jgi:ankyrin repeat protein
VLASPCVQGNTALYYACLCGHLEVVHFLLERVGGAGSLSPGERLRNRTNALNQHVRELLDGVRPCDSDGVWVSMHVRELLDGVRRWWTLEGALQDNPTVWFA